MNRIKPVPDFKTLAGLFLVPLVHQKEIADIPMLDTAPAHVKFVQRNNILREVVTDGIISPKLPGNGFLRRKEIRHLNIQLLSAFAAHKVDPLVSGSANGYFVPSSHQFQIDNVLKDEVDVLCVAPEHRFTDAVVGNVVFFVGRENMLALQIFAFHLIEQISIAAVFDVVQDRLRRYGALLVFEELCQRCCRKGRSPLRRILYLILKRKLSALLPPYKKFAAWNHKSGRHSPGFACFWQGKITH